MLRTAFVIFTSGRDSNHLIYKIAPKDPNWLFVGPEFHSLHHVYPDRYIGSFIKVLNWILAFGRAIVTELEREGVNCIRKLKFGTDWDHNNFDKALAVLSTSDVLILAHGSKDQDAVESNCNSAIRLVKLYKQYRVANPSDPTLPEVWYVGSEIEFHPSWGNAPLQRYSQSKRQFLPHPRSFYDDPDILYRHIVPASFHSSMGPAVLAADGAAKYAMWWIRRGARYIPVTYTGVAYLNYFKFVLCVPYAQDACVE
ncbi:uncharacterized protein N7477_007332 [Penicillium maclennaniae]|uniref:uncharacterized protein n=1 Tax=Penicillium maclennaniae TaxID=1343394 RepID=UPI0025417649|nr:uncharacterized protein N7477_007332 [Penicillium maclennaniae]KAJ5664884.1 hypothetical protein N7477_007332 [Penicillium maclennaniae]